MIVSHGLREMASIAVGVRISGQGERIAVGSDLDVLARGHVDCPDHCAVVKYLDHSRVRHENRVVSFVRFCDLKLKVNDLNRIRLTVPS